MQLLGGDINPPRRFSGKYETNMFRFVVMTCGFHVYDMFDEMLVMASRGQINSLIKCLH